MVTSVLAAAMAMGGAGPVRVAVADEAADVKAQAKMHFQNAETAMAEGRYAAAAAEYGAAYEVIKDPFLFYKIAVAHQLGGKCGPAVIYFKRYLKEGKPPEDFAVTVKEKMAECGEGTGEEAVGTEIESGTETGTETDTGTGTETGTEPGTGTETETDPDPDPDTGTLPPEDAPSFLDDEPTWKKTGAWVSVAATVAFGTAGAILMMSGESREEDLQSLGDFRDPAQGRPVAYEGQVADRYEALVDEGDRFNTYSMVAFGAAGVAAITAVTLFVLDRGSQADSGSTITHLTPVITSDTAGASFSLRF